MASTYYATLSPAEILEDLASRFLVNLPPEERTSLERIGFQVEQAHWYYEDFVRPQNPSLPGYHMRTFCTALLKASGLEVDGDPSTAYDRFLKYKFAVPVCGAIILNESLDKAVLVKGFKSGASWSFPRGKINQNESDRDCAVREVWEEVGYDLSPHFDPSVRPHPPTSKAAPPPLPDDIELDDMIELRSGETKLKLFVVPSVPETTAFETRTRNEISRIDWFPIASLPGFHEGSRGSGVENLPGHKFYQVAQVVRPLRAWIKRHKKQRRGKRAERSSSASPAPAPVAQQSTEEASNALKALFLGPDHAKRLPQPVASTSKAVVVAAEPGDVAILRRADAPLANGGKATTTSAGLLDQAERKRKEADLLEALLIGSGQAKRTAAQHQQQNQPQDLLATLFSTAPAAQTRAAAPKVNDVGALFAAIPKQPAQMQAPPPTQPDLLSLLASAPNQPKSQPTRRAEGGQADLLSALFSSPPSTSAAQPAHPPANDVNEIMRLMNAAHKPRPAPRPAPAQQANEEPDLFALLSGSAGVRSQAAPPAPPSLEEPDLLSLLKGASLQSQQQSLNQRAGGWTHSTGQPQQVLSQLAARDKVQAWSAEVERAGQPHRASHSPERQMASETLLSSLRTSQNGRGNHPPVPPAQHHQPVQPMPPPQIPFSQPGPFYGMPGSMHLPGGPMPAGVPFPGPPPHSHMMPFPPPGHFHSPPAPVTVSSAGPPLQPTPRRPITLLNVPTPPPPPVAPSSQNNADTLLGLLNGGGMAAPVSHARL